MRPRTVERGPAAQAGISRVGEIDFAHAAYKELPPGIRLQMIQAKARVGDAVALALEHGADTLLAFVARQAALEALNDCHHA